jgi:hypothetical protein
MSNPRRSLALPAAGLQPQIQRTPVFWRYLNRVALRKLEVKNTAQRRPYLQARVSNYTVPISPVRDWGDLHNL